MVQHLVFLCLGIGNGSVFAALALALVVTYRSSGVVNFATSGLALYAAYTYALLRQGKFMILIPGLPKTVDLGSQLGLAAAMALSLAITGVLGLLLYLVVFRPLRTAPPVARAVASIGVSVVFTGLTAARLGTTPLSVEPIYPSRLWTHGSFRVASDRVYFALTILAVALALGALYRFTRFGLATRAAAETEKGAYLSGLSPDRIAALNWIIGALVAGLAGILIAPIVPLVPVAYTLFIVPALAAAILGRFQYLVPAVVGGLAIGMLQSETQHLESLHHWLPSSGLPELIPLVLILIVLVARARALPERGAVILSSLGRAPRPAHIRLNLVVFGAIAVIGLFVLSGQWLTALITSLVFGVIALSMVVVTGYAGQVSLTQLPLAGAAGFLVGPLTDDWHLPFPVAPLVAALFAMVLGVVIGLPALRVRGLTVAVVTFALAYALEAIWFRNSDIVPSSGVDVPSPSLFGWDLGIGSGPSYPRVRFGLLCLVVLALTALAVARLRTSRLGSQMLAVRANERSAAAAGINVTRIKIVAFAIASFIAGIGGCLVGYQQGNITFDPVSAFSGLALFTTVYIAGITSVSGGVLAGFLAVEGLSYLIIDKILSTGLWYDVLSGVGVVLTVVGNPEGIVGPMHSYADRHRRRGLGEPALGAQAAPVPAQTRPAPVRPAPVLGPDVLTVRGLTVRYGGVVAVDDVSFAAPEGAIVGLIGPNGAGKTTLMDAISGFVSCSGSVELAGTPVERLAPHERVRAGLGRTFQAIELYEDLSVAENVSVGTTALRGRGGGAHRDVEDTLALLGLAGVRDRPAGELSQGQRQLISIARALAGNPRVLLLDEPAGGLDTTESQWLGERLRDIRDSGVTILLIDHDMSLVLGLCDRIEVINFGSVIASGSPAEIRSDRRVAAAYLGSTHAEDVPA
ncbi:amino acid/amide ABC transporter membrane protein 1 [Frankia torreyi]|uniref:Amino acid/amide ABC transporter membrane protein 1 n=1 Tax=Frankia torreyi TaxID=1856 RepID=A0A0D8BGR1_9ACTN|nr:branched-chain amino acid ABC transporter permease/ATP-binding protein [Frankia torreyi]KJE23316.1 amino acid/amide ABC transporter membrane protein 1 [Frankia torreyi]